MTNEDAQAIVAGTVDEVKAKLAGLSTAELALIRTAEMTGSSRTTLIAAIDAATGSAMVEGTGLADRPDRAATGETPPADPAIDAAAPAASPPATIPSTSSDDDTPKAAVPGTLTGYSLDQLQTMRVLELERVGGDVAAPDVVRLDDAMHALAAKAKEVPEIDYGATKSRTVATPSTLDALRAGPVTLDFSEGATRIRGVAQVQLTLADFSITGGRAVLERGIKLGRDLEAGRLTHVTLLDDDDLQVGVCEVPGGLPVGGGREAELPAGTLIF